MTDDKILFLTFPFISDQFNVEFVRVTYQEFVKELNLKDAWEFDRVLNWFKDDKIDCGVNHFRFSHPSYSEALEYLLVEDGYITEMNKNIFSKLLLKLSEKDEAVLDLEVAWAVASNYDKLPEAVRNLLFILSEKDGAARHVASAVKTYFDKLPEAVRNNLLLKLSEKDEAAWDVAWAVAENFDELPEAVRNLLFILSIKNGHAVVSAVEGDFDKKLPASVRNLLFKLSEKDEASKHVARVVAENFDKLPEAVRNNLLLKLSEKDEAARHVARVVAENFDKLPEDIRNLLDMLQEPLHQLIEDLSGSEEEEDKEEALHLITNALPKINQDFALKIFYELRQKRKKC